MFGFDPLGFARDAYDMFMGMLVQFIAVSIDFSGVKLVQELIGNAAGLGVLISGYVAIVMVLTAIVVRKHRFNAIVSVVVVLLSPLLFTLWLALLDGLRAIGATFSGAIVGIDLSAIKSSIVLPYPPLDIASAVWNFPVFILSAAWAMTFMTEFAMMSIFNVVLGILGFWLLMLYGLGPRTRRAFSIVLSIAIVTFGIGQPAVLAIIKFSNFIGGLMPITPGSVGLAGLFGLAGMLVAQFVLVMLPFLIYFPVNAVVGRVVSSVSNLVNTRVNNKHNVDAKVTGNVTAQQTNRATSTQKASYKAERAAHLRREIGNTGSAALTAMLKKATITAAAAGSNVHPAAKAVYLGGALLLKGVANAPVKQGKEKAHNAYR